MLPLALLALVPILWALSGSGKNDSSGNDKPYGGEGSHGEGFGDD